jgi:hypothetical protein
VFRAEVKAEKEDCEDLIIFSIKTDRLTDLGTFSVFRRRSTI